MVERNLLPNFIFGPEDIVVVIGQDGLVANPLKYSIFKDTHLILLIIYLDKRMPLSARHDSLR
ncbi:MAG: hypothetical protein ACI8VC_000410 [Candidatus Endobugula sp.]|jgi:hypothetical protein